MKAAQCWKMFAVLGVMVLLGAQAGVSRAADEAIQAPNATPVSGEIAAIDSQGSTVSLKGTDNPTQQPQSFQVTAHTVILGDNRPLNLADLKAGDKVVVAYATIEGKEVADSITVQP